MLEDRLYLGALPAMDGHETFRLSFGIGNNMVDMAAVLQKVARWLSS